MTTDDRLSFSDVAKMLGVARVTVWRWAKEGKLKAYKIGGRAYTSHADVEVFKQNYIVEMAEPAQKITISPYAVVTS